MTRPPVIFYFTGEAKEKEDLPGVRRRGGGETAWECRRKIGKWRKMVCHTILGCRGGRGRKEERVGKGNGAEPVRADGREEKVLGEQGGRGA